MTRYNKGEQGLKDAIAGGVLTLLANEVTFEPILNRIQSIINIHNHPEGSQNEHESPKPA